MNTDIKVKLIARSAENRIVGREGEHYRVKVTAPPVEGRANKALIALLSEKLGIAKKSIEIFSGKTTRLKTLRIHDLTEAEIGSALEENSLKHGGKGKRRCNK
ncbi:MAG: DUF167 domain-containing protein [Deltaproteobacteria bacterium]|nr:DUF167 domain-containing protein [Deltaproteobacteria bacterium]